MRRAVVVARVRQWWPEGLWAGFWVPVAVFDHRGGLFLALFCTGVAAAGWAMGHHHRSQTLHGKIDRLTAGFTGLAEDLRGQEPESARPRLTVVPPAS